MQEYGAKIADGAKVQCVTMALEGTMAEWMVTLHNDVSELRNFDHFMAALQMHFEDSLADHQARDHIKTTSQGQREVAKYSQEFCNLACQLTGHRTC